MRGEDYPVTSANGSDSLASTGAWVKGRSLSFRVKAAAVSGANDDRQAAGGEHKGGDQRKCG